MTENRFNYTKSYYFFQLGRLKVCTIFSVIFAALGFPLINLLWSIEDSDIDMDAEILIPLLLLGIFCVLGTCAMSYITPILTYRHLYTKTNADNILSLPLTANQRFFADTAAAYTSFALPYLISCGLSALIVLIGNPDSEALKISKYAFMGFFLLISFSALNIGVITCCGRIVEAILYPIVINSAMPLICALAIQMSYTDCVGLDIYSDDLFRNPAVRIWPFGNAIGLAYSDSATIYVYAVIMTAVFLGAAYLGYTKRRAENIGKPFVFRYSYLIASSLVAITLVFGYTLALDMEPARGNFGVVIPLAIILFIIMLIMEIINYKKIMSVIKFILRYAAILCGGIFACFLFLKSGGFGAENYIPTANSVNNVVVRYNIYDANGTHAISNTDVRSGEMIDLVRAEHENIIRIAKESKNNHNYDQHIIINYTLKTGETISRGYDFPEAAEIFSPDFWQKLYNSTDFRTSEINNIENNEKLKEIGKATIQLKNYHSSKVYLEYVTSDIGGLTEALEKDLTADEQFGRHDEAPVGILYIGYRESDLLELHKDEVYAMSVSADGFMYVAAVTLYESYENTLSLLKTQGTVPTPEEMLEDSVKNCEVFMLYRTLKPNSDHPTTEIYNSGEASAIFVTAEEFKELASHHVKYNLPAESDGEYNYHVIRGLWQDLNHYQRSKTGFIECLNDIGIYYDDYSEYEFLDDDSIYYKDNCYETDINESMNEYCDSLFAERKHFNYYS